MAGHGVQDEIFIEPHDAHSILFGVGTFHVHNHEPGDAKQILVPMYVEDINNLIRRLEEAKSHLKALPEN